MKNNHHARRDFRTKIFRQHEQTAPELPMELQEVQNLLENVSYSSFVSGQRQARVLAAAMRAAAKSDNQWCEQLAPPLAPKPGVKAKITAILENVTPAVDMVNHVYPPVAIAIILAAYALIWLFTNEGVAV